MASFFDIMRPVVDSGNRPSVRALDRLYGPQAMELRRRVASIAYGEELKKSDKRCQYGSLRRKLLDVSGVTGNCIAVEDAAFQEMFTRVFQGDLR